MSLATPCLAVERTAEGWTVRGISQAIRALGRERVDLTIAVLVHPGELLGEHRVDVLMRGPDGRAASERMSAFVQLPEISGGELCVIDALAVSLAAGPGVYWLEVSFDGRLLLRRPVQVEVGGDPSAGTS